MRRLVVVSRERASFLPTAQIMFAGESGVGVMLDRRLASRRKNGVHQPPSLDQRLRDRRGHPDVEAAIQQTGFAVVSLD